MAEIKYRVCDKCGEPLRHCTWKLWKRPLWLRLSYRTPDPYNYSDYDYELCDKCGKALQEYLRTPPANKGGTGNEIKNHSGVV